MTVVGQDGLELTVIGIAADHRMAGSLSGCDDVATAMRGIVEEIRHWMQEGELNEDTCGAGDDCMKSLSCFCSLLPASRFIKEYGVWCTVWTFGPNVA